MRIVRKRVLAKKSGVQTVQIEPGANVIFVEGNREGRNSVNVWFECFPQPEDQKHLLETAYFRVVYTDIEFPDNFYYVGSTVTQNNEIVHIYQSDTDPDAPQAEPAISAAELMNLPPSETLRSFLEAVSTGQDIVFAENAVGDEQKQELEDSVDSEESARKGEFALGLLREVNDMTMQVHEGSEDEAERKAQYERFLSEVNEKIAQAETKRQKEELYESGRKKLKDTFPDLYEVHDIPPYKNGRE